MNSSNKKRLLLVQPESWAKVYRQTNVAVAAPSYPPLTLASLAGAVRDICDVHILDLNLAPQPMARFEREIAEFEPDWVGISILTPTCNAGLALAAAAKKLRPATKVVVGGVHATTFPEEIAANPCVDVVVVGEGEEAIRELMTDEVQSPGKIVSRHELPDDLNCLPIPDYGALLDSITSYRCSHVASLYNPVALFETSRGCAFRCNFCNKNTFGFKHRTKSPERVVAEMRRLREMGFREIHFIDDSFTQKLDRAKEVCRLLLQENPHFTWSLFNGVRVDLVDEEFFSLAKAAGCWMVAFGIESGSQEVLDRIGKRTNIAEIQKAVKMAHRAGLDTFGFFMLGLSGESERSMQATIELALSLPLSIAKFDITTPYPGTPFYQELDGQGLIRTKNWDEYVVHGETQIYEHPTVRWELLRKYYKKGFRRYYLRPSYWIRRLVIGLKRKTLLRDLAAFLKTKWF